MPISAAHKTNVLHGIAVLACSSVGIVPDAAYDLMLRPYRDLGVIR